jgi:tetratricopeptide (TPR) repeat protein
MIGLSIALVVQRQAMQQEAKWRSREQSTFREMVSMYSDITDQVIAGTPLELNELMPSLERSIPLLETSISENTDDLPLIHRLSVLKHYLAIGYQRLGDYPRSIQTREELLRILDKLIERDPRNEKYRFDRFMSLLILAELRPDAPGGAQGRAFAKPTIERAIETIEALLREHPNNIDYQDAYAAALSVQASIVKLDDPSRAIQILNRVIKESKDLYSAHTDRLELAKHSYFASLTTAEILFDLGEQDEALAAARDGIAFYTQVRYPLKDETGILLEATNIQGRYRELLRKCGELKSALAYSQDLQSIYRMLSSRELSAEYLVADIENHLIERWLLDALGRHEKAADCEKELLEKVSAAMDEPRVIGWLRTYEVSLLPQRLVSLIQEHHSPSAP